jgi:hypothetical protein
LTSVTVNEAFSHRHKIRSSILRGEVFIHGQAHYPTQGSLGIVQKCDLFHLAVGYRHLFAVQQCPADKGPDDQASLWFTDRVQLDADRFSDPCHLLSLGYPEHHSGGLGGW